MIHTYLHFVEVRYFFFFWFWNTTKNVEYENLQFHVYLRNENMPQSAFPYPSQENRIKAKVFLVKHKTHVIYTGCMQTIVRRCWNVWFPVGVLYVLKTKLPIGRLMKPVLKYEEKCIVVYTDVQHAHECVQIWSRNILTDEIAVL